LLPREASHLALAPAELRRLQPDQLRPVLPASASGVVRRQRLITSLHTQIHRRLTIVVAPAGYGKTTLLADFASDCANADLPIAVCWYTATSYEADAAAVLKGLVLAVRSRSPSFGQRTLRLLDAVRLGPSPTDAERLTASAVSVLVGELAEQVHSYTLVVVDDFHHLDRNLAARAVVELLLQQLPPHVHLALLSRTVPALDTSRLLLADEVSTLGPRDLAFTADELTLFLRHRYGIEPEPALVEQVHRRTEGWIAALVLAMPASPEGPPSARATALLTALSDAWSESAGLHEYLALQMFRRQLPADQDVLLAAALPDVCGPSDLDCVLERADSGMILARLERAGIPLTRLDAGGNRYRMHALLQQFLRRYLQQTDRRRFRHLHLRWGAVAEAQENFAAAMGHYLAGGQEERAARLLERVGERLIDCGQRQLVEEWVRQLPESLIQRRPRLGLVVGRLALAQGRPLAAIERARHASFAGQRRRDSVAAHRALLLEAMATVAAGRAEDGRQLCVQALAQRTVRRRKPLLAEAYRSLSIAEGIRGLLDPALSHMEQALALYEHAGRTWDVALALNNVGVLYEQLGQTDRAGWCHTRALALQRELGDLAGVARSLNNLGSLHFYRGAYAEGETTFREVLALADQTANRRSQAAAYVNLGDLQLAQQRPTDALANYRAGLAVADTAVDPRWGSLALIGQAAAHLALGDHAAASRAGREALDGALRSGFAEVAGHARAVLAAAALVGGRPREAATLLDEARGAVRETSSKALEVRVYLWSATAAYQQRRWGEALACVEVAAQAASMLGGPALFALEGAVPVPLLQMAAARGVAVDVVTGALDQLDASAAAATREAAATRAPPPVAPAPLPAISLHLLGTFSGTIAGRPIEGVLPPRSRVRELLAYLAVHVSGRRREEIGADLWPEAQPGQEVTLTYTTLHRLRQALFPEIVTGDVASGAYRINPAVPLQVDVHRFERCMREAARPSTSLVQRRKHLVSAVDAYRGPLLPECYTDWAVALRERLERRYTLALAQLVDTDWAAGDYRACLRWCEQLLSVEPAEEAIHCRTLECYERLKEPLAGLLHYRRYARELAETEGPAPPNGRPGAASLRIAAVVRRLETSFNLATN
jgi:ATP/maltotriose-dependent transcriptional regulator MalT/DNA-binding SARP family transcriptional activator